MPRSIAALIRHGDYRQLPDTPSAHQPFALTEQGMAQAVQAAELLQQHSRQLNCPIHPAIASSTLLRAWQTATIIGDNLPDTKTSVQQHEELAERCVGAAANLSIGQITDILRHDPRYREPPADWKSNSHYRLPFPGAESLMQAGKRVAELLIRKMRTVRQQNRGDRIKVIVGHGAAFRHAAHHLGILEYDQIARLSMYHCRPVLLELHDDDSWSHIGGEWKIRQQSENFMD